MPRERQTFRSSGVGFSGARPPVRSGSGSVLLQVHPLADEFHPVGHPGRIREQFRERLPEDMLHDPLRRGARDVHRAHPGRVVRPAVVRDEDADRRHEPLRDRARLQEAVVGPELAPDGIAVLFALVVEVLRLRVAPEPVHRRYPEVVQDAARDVLGDLDPELDLEPERVEVDDLKRLEPRVRRHEHALRRPVQDGEREPHEPLRAAFSARASP